MKVTLDLDRLLQAGSITKEEYLRFETLARESSKSHAFGILTVLAAIAAVFGFVGLNPQFFAEMVKAVYEALGKNGLYAATLAAVVAGAYAARSGFLAGLSALVILSWMGGSSMYSHAAYFIAIREPAPTLIVFSILGIVGLIIAEKLPWDRKRLALIFSRTCLFLVNMCFWVGSLWGSRFFSGQVPDYVFAVLWAVVILGVGAWGASEGRLFVVNISAVFGSIHFYTQWFEKLGGSAGSLFLAGVTALLITWQMAKYNRKVARANASPPPPPAG